MVCLDAWVDTVPSERMTDQQATKYKPLRVYCSQEACAAETGISMGSSPTHRDHSPLDRALRLRGSRAFDAMHGCEQFVAEVVCRLNARCARGWEAGRAFLRPLPARRTADFEEIDA